MIHNVDHQANLMPSCWPHNSAQQPGAKGTGNTVDKRWGVLTPTRALKKTRASLTEFGMTRCGEFEIRARYSAVRVESALLPREIGPCASPEARGLLLRGQQSAGCCGGAVRRVRRH